MKRILTAIAAVLIFIPATVLASAVLIDAQGEVEVTVAGRSEPGKVGLELPDGSTVRVKEGSAQVLLESGAMDEVGSGSSYTVGQKKPSDNRTEMGSGITLAMRELAASDEGPTVHGMVKKVGGPIDVQGAMMSGGGAAGLYGTYPRGTAIVLGDTATFSWSQPVSFKGPAVVISDSKRHRLATPAVDAGSTSFSKSSAGLGLKPGRSYTWYIGERQGKGVRARTGNFDFSTLSAAEAKALEGEVAKVRAMKMSEDGKELLISQIYFKAGLYHDTVESLKPLYERTKSPYAKKMLVLGYRKMGLNPEAAKYR